MSEVTSIAVDAARLENPPAGFFRRWAERRSPRRVKVSTSLRLLHEVLGLEHLHYGLWDGEPLGIEGLRAAQQRYAERLVEWIPKGVSSVLDVGAGTGVLSRLLSDRGYAVEGLSPDPYQKQLYERRTHRPFHLVRFQELQQERRYDLVLMSESAQYVWLDRLFPTVCRCAPGGHLLLADYFRTSPEKGSGHHLEAFRAAAAAHGLTLVREDDVTEATLRTLDLARHWIETHVEPVLTILTDAAAAQHPYLLALARRLFPGRWRKLAEARLQVDSDHFRRTRRYLFLLYRVPPLADRAG